MQKLLIIVFSLFLSGCAADVSNYTPLMDPKLETPSTKDHLQYCRDEVAKLNKKIDFTSALSQSAQSSFSSWIGALETGTATAVETAVGFTVFGAIVGIRSDNSTDQAKAEARVNNCMSNYHEPTLDK